MKPRKSRHWLSRKFTCFLVLLAMLFSMAGGAINPAPVYAANDTESDAATSLTIKAGTATSSNPTTVYTTLKTFSEEEMTAKATTQQMYSYFDSMPAPVKDAATGVPLADLLNEVGISLDNVERIYFYCTDITTGPYSNRTKAYLFDTPRYYFPLIGDSWDPDEYKPAASGTWGDDPTAGKVAVEPMLAVSDNWKRVLFAGEPDFNTQDPGTRFRLVNGQSESDYLNGTITASTSAKWVHEIDVKLISAPVTGVTLDQSAITLAPGESEQLTATVTPAYASDPSVSWSSDNPSAATVEANGVITAVAGGNATITVTTTDGSFTATCAVTVDVEAPGPQTPPTLTADTTDNTVGQAVDITFTDDEAWRTAISGITVGGTPLTGEQYTVTAGNINIAAAVFTAAGDYSIAVTANGYSDAAVTQTMTTGGPQIPVSLSLSKSAASTGEWITASGTGPANTWISLRVLDADGNVVVFDAVKSDSQGNYSIEFGVPAAEGDALNVIVGFGTNIASATLGLKLDPPALTADTSNNVVGQSIDITFSPDTDWQAAISGITVNGNNLTSGQYTISDGNINITAGAFSAAGSYQITVTAAGYKDAQVTQTIAAKTPPALTADTINNVVGQSIDITFSPDADWQEAISGITVNGNNLSSGQYTISDGNINITAGAFSAAGSYQITVTAANYADATVNQEILGAAPGLTADITNNSPEQTIEITFTDNEAWRNAITGITVDEVSIAGKYTIAPGVITLDNTVFTETGSFSVAVKATGYADATVTQNILNPCYLITPEADQIYVISENQDGIKIMTVNPGVSGMKYFNVGVTPVRIHNGAETLVFVHKRDGLQLSLNTSRGDFDLIDGGGAGFNVSAGDIIKVYMVDQLTNAIDFNPTIFQ
jgi:hypothetical protein